MPNRQRPTEIGRPAGHPTKQLASLRRTLRAQSKPAAARTKRFRLVGQARPQNRTPERPAVLDQPMTGPNDPRWIVAVRTAERLQGDLLTPQHRQELHRLGKLTGLTPFSVSLIIAIVQDQARRGYAPSDCPTAGEMQLRLVQLPSPARKAIDPMRTAFVVAALLATELVLIAWWLAA